MTDISTILIIDHSVETLDLIGGALRAQYRVLTANSAEVGLLLAGKQPKPHLIVLSENMPDKGTGNLLTLLRENPASSETPILLLTEHDSELDCQHALQLGLMDFISKPIKPAALLARVRLQIDITQLLAENKLVQQTTIRALAHLAELSDPETSNHILRTSGYVRHLANSLLQHPRFIKFLTRPIIDAIAQSAALHDIGKIAISDNILLKSGKLMPEEWGVMKTHALLGSQAISKAMRGIKPPVPLLVLAKEIAHWHHEKWDGSGYPDGLVGDAIPISARLMALADVFDALINARVYKPAMTNAEAREIIIAGRGKHFDPDMVDAFIEHFDDFVAIAKKYQDIS